MTADDVLLHAFEVVGLAGDGGFVEHLGGFLEGRGGHERLGLQGGTGDTLKDLRGGGGDGVAHDNGTKVAALELRDFVAANPENIGFVPTMGALHDGHASLIKKCVAQNKTAIVSTFVNPTQFLAGEDFESYPKNEQNDAKICEELGVHAMFAPEARELYFDTEPLISAPENLASVLEGKTRPGHFDGVLRVLNKLFNLTNAKRVYMGKKDAQQLLIVRNFVKESSRNR